MIVQSNLPFVVSFDAFDVTIKPGRNAIRDDVARKLVESKPWKEQMATKHPAYAGKVVVVVAPAEDPEALAAAGKKPKTAPAVDTDKGESAVSNLKMADAIKHIRSLDIVDQIQDIQLRDPRQEVKDACEQRIADLAEAQRKLAGKPDADLGPDPEGPEGDPTPFKDDERIK